MSTNIRKRRVTSEGPKETKPLKQLLLYWNKQLLLFEYDLVRNVIHDIDRLLQYPWLCVLATSIVGGMIESSNHNNMSTTNCLSIRLGCKDKEKRPLYCLVRTESFRRC